MEKNPHTSEQIVSNSQKAEGDEKNDDNLTLAEIFCRCDVFTEEVHVEVPKAESELSSGELLARIEKQKRPRKYKRRKPKYKPKKCYAIDQPTKRKAKPPPPEFHPVWEKRLEKLICGHNTCASKLQENLTVANADSKMEILEEDLYVTVYKNEDNKFCLLFLIKASSRSNKRSVLTMNALKIVERITYSENMEMEIKSEEFSDHCTLPHS